ncbi:hypothetical protein ADUPG1_008194 [Aduncisulcus paluster]|uniref:SEP domain-containing protein n=1 Tax=Aduncisulcus paluster TaxID=2918883 RepID=A0ABQ5KR37_9EUKA|nr:hypothetical protein ADUPG1_008194 [Aduncisulcus paluster]
MDSDIKQLCEITGMGTTECSALLRSAGGDLTRAVEFFLEQQSLKDVPYPAPSHSTGGQKRETPKRGSGGWPGGSSSKPSRIGHLGSDTSDSTGGRSPIYSKSKKSSKVCSLSDIRGEDDECCGGCPQSGDPDHGKRQTYYTSNSESTGVMMEGHDRQGARGTVDDLFSQARQETDNPHEAPKEKKSFFSGDSTGGRSPIYSKSKKSSKVCSLSDIRGEDDECCGGCPQSGDPDHGKRQTYYTSNSESTGVMMEGHDRQGARGTVDDLFSQARQETDNPHEAPKEKKSFFSGSGRSIRRPAAKEDEPEKHTKPQPKHFEPKISPKPVEPSVKEVSLEMYKDGFTINNSEAFFSYDDPEDAEFLDCMSSSSISRKILDKYGTYMDLTFEDLASGRVKLTLQMSDRREMLRSDFVEGGTAGVGMKGGHKHKAPATFSGKSSTVRSSGTTSSSQVSSHSIPSSKPSTSSVPPTQSSSGAGTKGSIRVKVVFEKDIPPKVYNFEPSQTVADLYFVVRRDSGIPRFKFQYYKITPQARSIVQVTDKTKSITTVKNLRLQQIALKKL